MKTYGRKLVPITAIGILAVIGYAMTTARQAVAQNPNAGSAPVHIVSPSPLPVTSADNPATQPVIGNFGQCSTSGQFCTFSSVYSIPANKRLVVEYASADALLP